MTDGAEKSTGPASDPVVVVGAGPVGLTIALLLARFGVSTTVLEAADGPDRVGSKAICMQHDALDVLERVGVAQAMVREGVTWRLGRTYYRDTELFANIFPDEDPGSLPPWINISQCSTEGLLRDRVSEEPLVDLCWGHRVTDLQQSAGAVEVGVEGPLGQARLKASFVVGADGSRSAVRRLLGIGFPGRSYADQFLIADVRSDLGFPNERRFYFDPAWNPGRQVLVHECPGGVWRIDWQVPADYDLDAERASGALDERIRRIVGKNDYEVVWLSVYRFHERVAETFRVKRVLLAGDAAHLYAPFGARGLNSGIQDADNLAWKLAFLWRGWVGGSGKAASHVHEVGCAGEVLLRSYQTERGAAAAENLALTTATMDFLIPQGEAQWAHRREVLERAVTEEGARSQVDSGKLAEPFVYASSPLTTPGWERGTGAAQSACVVPGALCPDGALAGSGRLRQRFGTGLVVLAEDVGAAAVARVASRATGLLAPVTVYPLRDLDPSGALAGRFQLRPGEAVVVRPDGHVAAIVAIGTGGEPPSGSGAGLLAALRRVCGQGDRQAAVDGKDVSGRGVAASAAIPCDK